MQRLLAAVRAAFDDRNEAVAFERQDVSSERGSIHDELSGQGIDGHRAVAFEPGQDRILGRAQAGGRQALVIELGDVSGCLTEGQAAALGEGR